jgi:Diacylglycerol kinase catalytic domain
MMQSVAVTRRVSAVVALLAPVAQVTLAVLTLVARALIVAGAVLGLVAGLYSAAYALTRTGGRRAVAAVLAILALTSPVVLILVFGGIWDFIAILGVGAAGAAAARYALGRDIKSLKSGPKPGEPVGPAQRPVLLMNPRSGGGKVERFALVEETRRRGIEPVVLGPGDDFSELARAAVAKGADVIGMAGGDGSQALVAEVAMRHDVGYVCVPAGTRNHLAMDLGLDRNDVVGAAGPARSAHPALRPALHGAGRPGARVGSPPPRLQRPVRTDQGGGLRLPAAHRRGGSSVSSRQLSARPRTSPCSSNSRRSAWPAGSRGGPNGPTRASRSGPANPSRSASTVRPLPRSRRSRSASCRRRCGCASPPTRQAFPPRQPCRRGVGRRSLHCGRRRQAGRSRWTPAAEG